MATEFKPHPSLKKLYQRQIRSIDFGAVCQLPFVAEDDHADASTLPGEMPYTVRGIYSAVGGNIRYRRIGDDADKERTVGAGETLIGLFSHVISTGSAAVAWKLLY
jgi:hypothetical protein